MTPSGYVTRESYDRMAQVVAVGGVIELPDEETVVWEIVDMLITRLYDPHPEGFRTSNRVLELGCEDESINWGDLACNEVIKNDDGTFSVYVEEADADSVHLRTYLQTWLQAWGWDAEVHTEW